MRSLHRYYEGIRIIEVDEDEGGGGARRGKRRVRGDRQSRAEVGAEVVGGRKEKAKTSGENMEERGPWAK